MFQPTRYVEDIRAQVDTFYLFGGGATTSGTWPTLNCWTGSCTGGVPCGDICLVTPAGGPVSLGFIVPGYETPPLMLSRPNTLS